MLSEKEGGDVADAISTTQTKLEDVVGCIRVLRERIDHDPRFEVFVEKIAEWEKHRAVLTDILKPLQSVTTPNLEEILYETKKLIEVLHDMTGEELSAIRSRLRATIAELVESIWLLVYEMEVPKRNPRHGKKRQQVVDVQVFFRGGGVRQACMLLERDNHRIFATPGGEALLGDQDLRTYHEQTYSPLGRSVVQMLHDPDGRDLRVVMPLHCIQSWAGIYAKVDIESLRGIASGDGEEIL